MAGRAALAHPVVLGGGGARHALLGVRLQERLEQALGARRKGQVVDGRYRPPAPDRAQEPLARGVPPVAYRVPVRERGLAREKHVRDDARGPGVHLEVVRPAARHLRGQVRVRAAPLGQNPVAFLDARGEPEIAQLRAAAPIRLAHVQEVGRLHVAVHHAVRVARGERAEDGADRRRRRGLRERLPGLDRPRSIIRFGRGDDGRRGVLRERAAVFARVAGAREQVAAVAEVDEQVHAGFVLERVVQRDDVQGRPEREVQVDLVAHLALPDGHRLARGRGALQALRASLRDRLEREAVPVRPARARPDDAHRAAADGLAQHQRVLRVPAQAERERLGRFRGRRARRGGGRARDRARATERGRREEPKRFGSEATRGDACHGGCISGRGRDAIPGEGDSG